jgi:hypothetical protein
MVERLMLLAAVASIAGGAASAAAQSEPENAGGEVAHGEPAAPPRAAITREELESAIARVARGEPPVGVVVGEVLRVSAIDPDETSAMATRARVAGLLPIVRGGVRRGQGQDLSAQETGETGRATWSTDDDLSISGTLTFRLDRLLFAREEVPLLREDRARRAEQWEIVRTVVSIYYERRRLLVEQELLGADVARAVRIEELGALLDGFTRGAFSRMIARSR